MDYSFVLGEPFPIEEYAVPGDHIWPIVSESSFDVVQSLTDISPSEEHAFGYGSIDVSLFKFYQIPFVIFDFGGVFKSETAINIHKVNKNRIDHWFDTEDNTVTYYLLEGWDTCLRGIRYIEIPMMDRVKEILKEQLMLTKEDIDVEIMYGRSRFDVKTMVTLAQERCTIDKPKYHL